ncbi:hypothetical protein E8E11_008089 [Didymella keratinophila]|nr:hypothetical protein E8E11_008089 [Didymella keratinophila]
MASSHLPLPHSGGPIFPPTTQPIIVYESMGPDYDEVFLKGLVKQMTFEEKRRAWRRLYLKSFEIAIKASQPYSIMTAYNVINGFHADSNKYLLTDILRNRWGYNGQVVVDWGGVNSLATALNAGTDLEMPGPPSWRTVGNIQKVLDSGEVSMETIEARVLENLKFLQRNGGFDHPVIASERTEELPEHRALIRRAGAEGAVLLKNKNKILPLDKREIGSIAMIGLAKQCLSQAACPT